MKESVTEELIIETAKNVFFKQGNIHATTQDIADAAGINRALIHYYFRSREKLFDVVFMEAQKTLLHKMDKVLATDELFSKKVENFIDVFIEESLEYPYLENFIISEINRSKKDAGISVSKDIANSVLKKFSNEVLIEIKKDTLKVSTPLEFMINLLSLCSFAIIARPMIQYAFDIDDEQYKSFMKDRKRQILKMVFSE
jgi:TetR/AcrR family transcriptional regulator